MSRKCARSVRLAAVNLLTNVNTVVAEMHRDAMSVMRQERDLCEVQVRAYV